MAAKNIKIFIASAGEVGEERRKAAEVLGHLNNSHKHLWLQPVWWEKNAQRGNQPVHKTVQGGIDPQLTESDIILFIFYSRLGQYTLGEFELATKLNKKLFVYFKKGFSPVSTAENKAYAKLLKFKEGLNEAVLHEYYNDAEHFYGLSYQHLNQYLSDNYPPDDGSINIPDSPTPLPPDVLTLIKLLDEKEERIKQLEALLPINRSLEEVRKLTAEVADIRLQLSQSEELRQQQAADKAALEQQLATQKENDDLKVQALEAVEKGAYTEAEDLLKKSAKESIATTASTFHELAKLKKLQLQYREAFEYYELAAKIEPDNSLYLHDAGLIADQLGYMDKAIAYHEKSLSLIIEEYGGRHPEIATQYNNLGLAYNSKGEYDRAIDYYRQALEIGKEFYGEHHPDIATDYNNLGLAYYNKGEYDRAIGHYEKALEIGKEFYGEHHPNMAIRYNNLGLAYKRKGEYDRAVGYYERALDISKEFYGERHPDIAIWYSNLGSVYYSKDEHDRAISYYEQALAIGKDFYGERHPAIATRYNNLGSAYRIKGDYTRVIEYYEQALSIMQAFLPPTHPHIATVQKNLQEAMVAKDGKG